MCGKNQSQSRVILVDCQTQLIFTLVFYLSTSSKDKTVRSARVKSGLQHGVEAAETALQSEAETVEAAECKVIPSLDTSRVIPSL